MAVAVLISPRVTLSFNDEGIVKPRLNISDSSTILSFFIGTLTVVLLVPAVKLVVIGVEV